MGESAIKSHMRSAKHIANVQNGAQGNSIRNYVAATVSERPESAMPSVSSDLRHACGMNKLVTDAEVLWTLKVAASHYSYNSSSHTGELFQKMFPDSEIAKAFSCGEKKCAYVLYHGLRLYFLSCLQHEIEQCGSYVVLFDESLNDYLQRKQMDIHVRYWDAVSERVTTRYYTSVFMGHSRAEDIQEKLLNALDCLPLSKIVHLSMDGPNVNLKCFKNLQSHLQNNYQVQCLELGTCGLHTLHNAYRAGVGASKWCLDTLLSSLSGLFHDAPARRDDFASVTGQTTYPLNFVSHRWVENVPVIERAILSWPHVSKYVQCTRVKQVSLPKCIAFQRVCDACADPLTPAKLQFALGIAMIFKPFLTEYQGDKPLVFFLAKDLESVVRKLMTRFVRCSVVAASAGILSLLKIDIDDPKNHAPLEKVDLGHAAEQVVKAVKISAKDVFAFKIECKQFLINATKKILDKSPLIYPLVRALSLDPVRMCSRPDECLTGFRKVFGALIEANRLSEHQRDAVLAEYTELLQEEKHTLGSFEKHSKSLDEFFCNLLKFRSSCSNLWGVVKVLLILSHGQATVERGFSFNCHISIENMKEMSYVWQRIVCDVIDKAGGILKVAITKELRTSTSAAWNWYQAYLEEQKQQEAQQLRQSKRSLIENEIEANRHKKKKLEKTIVDLTAAADSYSKKAEAANDITYIVKSNSLRKTAKEKMQDLQAIDRAIAEKLQALS
ncbi:uncharacterized protein LOC144094048 [Amblyomma americanum]